MSTTEAANLQSQLAPAMANVMQRVYAPQFFAKLASLGVQPANEEEANTLLDLGLKLAELGLPVPQAAAAPAAAPTAGLNKFAEAVQSLQRLQFTSEELAAHQRKQAAYNLAQDPAVYNAALIVEACNAASVPAVS